jgi:hypothetical protein
MTHYQANILDNIANGAQTRKNMCPFQCARFGNRGIKAEDAISSQSQAPGCVGPSSARAWTHSQLTWTNHYFRASHWHLADTPMLEFTQTALKSGSVQHLSRDLCSSCSRRSIRLRKAPVAEYGNDHESVRATARTARLQCTGVQL